MYIYAYIYIYLCVCILLCACNKILFFVALVQINIICTLDTLSDSVCRCIGSVYVVTSIEDRLFCKMYLLYPFDMKRLIYIKTEMLLSTLLISTFFHGTKGIQPDN